MSGSTETSGQMFSELKSEHFYKIVEYRIPMSLQSLGKFSNSYSKTKRSRVHSGKSAKPTYKLQVQDEIQEGQQSQPTENHLRNLIDSQLEFRAKFLTKIVAAFWKSSAIHVKNLRGPGCIQESQRSQPTKYKCKMGFRKVSKANLQKILCKMLLILGESSWQLV